MSASENVENPGLQIAPENIPQAATPRWVGVALVLLAIFAIAAFWVSNRALSYSRNGVGRLDRETQEARRNADRLSATLSERLTDMDKQNASLRAEVNTLLGQLESVQDDTRLARKQAMRVGEQTNEQIRHLVAVDSEVQQQLVKKANADDLKTITSDVNGVRDELQTTSERLKNGHNEMGILIARNHDEIETLRQRGDRDYFEFTIIGKNESEKMGDITLTLRSADPKKNECNLELLVDDKTTQKRNRAINEPIFFYKEGERVPSEIVINDVRRNQVSGYLSVPKQKQQVALAGANLATSSNLH